MSFLGSLFGGQNSTLNSNIGSLGSFSGASMKEGQSDISTAGAFMRNILNGNTTSIAPQLSSIRKQGGQQKMSLSQFGNRSGGTNASMQASGDRTNASINDFISSLMGGAASGLASMGASQEGLSLSAMNQQTQDSQMQMEDWQKGLLGQGLSSGLGYLEGFGLGKLK